MAENPVRVVLDTNVIISAIGFGGKPGQILLSILEEKVQAITSSVLLSELEEIINKKFSLSKENIELIMEEIRNEFIIIQPRKTIKVSRDEDDNRVLEAAMEGGCDYIITGDRDLLSLEKYKHIKILTPEQSLSLTDQ